MVHGILVGLTTSGSHPSRGFTHQPALTAEWTHNCLFILWIHRMCSVSQYPRLLMMNWMSSWILMFPNWLHTLNLLQLHWGHFDRSLRLGCASFNAKKDIFIFTEIQWKTQHQITAESLICLFPIQTLLKESKCVSKSRELVWFLNQDTCCQFVSVVWLKDGLGPDSTSMLSLAEEGKEKNHADSAFCSAIFPSCSRPVKPQPAGGETVDGWEGSPEPQQLPGASVEPSEAL